MVNKGIQILLAILAVAVSPSFGQTTLAGKITNPAGEPLIGAAVVFQGTQYGGTTNSAGGYKIENVPVGPQTIEVSYLGYEKQITAVLIVENTEKHLDVLLQPDLTAVAEVSVFGKTKEQIKREEPIKIEVIDVEQVHNRSVSIPQIINQTSGVKVRQNGGVGSSTTININGLQGQSIRFFRNGIPMEYLGKAFNLSLLPVDQISNIEIYKGVLPVKIGSDALGGAVNIITRENARNHLDLSYSYGSFNTHLATLNTYYTIPKTKIFMAASAYAVYSDNNYKVKVDIADEETGNLKEAEVERFHGGVGSGFVEFKAGLKDTKFADLLALGAAFSDIEKELQNDFRMHNVFGEVMYYEKANIVTARYQKNLQRLAIDAFGAYSKQYTLFDDTPENSYDWYGNATPYEDEDHAGESSNSSDEVQSYRQLNYDHIVARLHLDFEINANHQLNFNHNYIYKGRVGSDPYAQLSSYGVDALTVPAVYVRNISGLGLTSHFFHQKITNVFALKRYQVFTHSVATSYDYYGEVDSASHANYGLGNSIKYNFTDNRYLRLSYEKATRIPTTSEYLGDSERDIAGNPELLPECSDNINFGFYTNLNPHKNLWLDVNLFYRYVQDNVVLKTYTLIQSRYENSDDTRVLGGEFTLKAHPMQSLNMNLSLTYQDIRRKNVSDIADILLADARRANIPYFFGNFGVSYHLAKEVLLGKWQFYGNYAYVEQYLLNEIMKSEEPSLFEEANSDSNIIPTQNIVDVGLTYKSAKLPLGVNLELNNLLNAEAYDGFRVQKPGRNFRVKINYSIH